MKRRTLVIPAVAAISLMMFGCPPKEGGAGGGGSASGNEILVGEYGSLTGPEATFGQSTHNGIMMALDEINAAGGVKGKKLRVITEDDQSKPDEAANAVQKLISQNGVVAVIGEVASSNTLAAAPIAQSNKVPMISPSSTNPKVTEVGDYIFRVCFIDPYQGEALANFMFSNLGMRKAAILRDIKSDYSMGLADFFQREFTRLGGQVVIDQSYSKGDSDFKAQLTAIKQAAPQAIFAPGYYTDIGQIAIQARDLGLTQPLVGGDGWESPKLIEIGGKALEGSFYSNHYHADDPDPRVKTFVEKYRERYGQKPDSLAALGYDAMKLLAQALGNASEMKGQALRDAIAQTQNFSAVTGNINFGADRNPTKKKLVVLEIKNGQLALKSSLDPANAGAPAGGAAPAAGTTAAPTTDTAPAAAATPTTDTAPATSTK